MKRIFAGTLTLILLGSSFLLGADGVGPQAKKKAKTKQPAGPTVAQQLEQLRDQVKAQQQQMQTQQQQMQSQINQLQGQLQTAQGQLAANSQQAQAAAQQAAAAQDAANSLNGQVSGLKTSTNNLVQTVQTTKKMVDDLESPLAMHYRGITIAPNGFLEGSMIWRQRAEGATTSSTYSGTPLNGVQNAGLSEFRMSAQNSQFGFNFYGDAGKVKFTGQWQMDLNAPSYGSTLIASSNNFVPRIRQAWANVATPGGWTFMAGQTWDLGMLNRHLIDQFTEWLPVGDDNGTFTGDPASNRVVQFRLTKNFWNNKAAFAVAVQGDGIYTVANDATTPTYVVGLTDMNNGVAPCAGTASSANNSQVACGINVNAQPYPAIWLKFAADPNSWGHFEVGFLGRFFRDRVLANTGSLAATGTNHTADGYGIHFGTYLTLSKKVGFYLNALGGRGIGQFLNSHLADVTLSASNQTTCPALTGTTLGTSVCSDGPLPIKAGGVSAGPEFHLTPKLDVNFYGGAEYYQRTTNLLGYTGNGYGDTGVAPGTDNKSLYEVMASVVYRWYNGPYGTFQTLVQPIWFERTTWASSLAGSKCVSGTGVFYGFDNCTAKGSNTMFFLSMRYVLP